LPRSRISLTQSCPQQTLNISAKSKITLVDYLSELYSVRSEKHFQQKRSIQWIAGWGELLLLFLLLLLLKAGANPSCELLFLLWRH
jgi:hypothetical protein